MLEICMISTKYPKIDGNDKKLSRFFGIELLATQTNSKSGDDVSQIIEPESLKIKSAIKADIQLEKDQKLVCRKISNLHKVPSILTLAYPLQNKFTVK